MHVGRISSLRQRILDRHNRWLAAAQTAAGLCLQATGGAASPEEMIQKLVAHPKLAPQLGAPSCELKLFKSQLHPYEAWLLNLWGRRCNYFISNLAYGLEQAARLQPQDLELARLVEEFGELGNSLSVRFDRVFQVGTTPEKSLLERGDLANFHNTYLDSVLFSALYQLQRSRRRGHEMGKEAREILWRLIRSEVSNSTEDGTGKSENVIDMSTVWWGFVELVKSTEREFELGAYSGWLGVVDVCRNLIHSNDGALRWPRPEEIIYEATPEIYGPLRTSILVALNCVNFADALPPRALAVVADDLSVFAGEQFTYILGRPEEVESHICWLGLGLQLSAAALTLSANWERREHYRGCVAIASQLRDDGNAASAGQNYFIVRKSKSEYQPVSKGNQPVSKVEELRLQRDAYDIFVDLDKVWVKRDGQLMQLRNLTPASRTLLMLFLRYGPIEMESDELYKKIVCAGVSEKNPFNERTQRSNLAAEVSRLRKKLGEIIDESIFDVPNKVKAKDDRGYSCSGTYSCCMILPSEAEALLRVKTFGVSKS